MKVKVSTLSPLWPLARQTPGSDGVWQDIHYHVNDPAVQECDYWVVIDGLPAPDTTICPPKNTILFTWEPPAIKRYEPDFLKQFATVVTSHSFRHRDLVRTQQGLQWMIGARNINGIWSDFKSYDFLKECRPEKEKEVSIIVSDKQYIEGHRQRIKFLETLQERFGNRVDVFGSGRNHIPDKFEAIYPYKYHIVLENSSLRDYWTEKLADALIGWSYPIYYGCENIRDYFSENMLATMDIFHPVEAADAIAAVLDGGCYERYLELIREARNLVFDVYNIFAVMTQIIRERTGSGKRRAMRKVTLNNERLSSGEGLPRGIRMGLRRLVGR